MTALQPSERWHSFIEGLTWERGSLDQSSHNAFLRAGNLGVDPQMALETVAVRIKAAGDYPKPRKLRQQLRRAYRFVGSARVGSNYLPKEQRPTFHADYAKAFADRIPAEIDAAWLRRRSPIRAPFLLSPAEFLASTYEMGDKVLVFSDYRSQGQLIWQRCSFKIDRDELNSFVKGHANGVWFLSNPVDGREHFNERQQTNSRRSEESIVNFRYAVLESDCQPLAQWLRILIQLPLPIVSITASGGKSLHALMRVDATSKTSWDDTIRTIKPKLIYLGADANALTAVRLTRLPNCYRGDRLQELLYVDPSPTGEPILTESNGRG